jgi:hypothetical protein
MKLFIELVLSFFLWKYFICPWYTDLYECYNHKGKCGLQEWYLRMKILTLYQIKNLSKWNIFCYFIFYFYDRIVAVKQLAYLFLLDESTLAPVCVYTNSSRSTEWLTLVIINAWRWWYWWQWAASIKVKSEMIHEVSGKIYFHCKEKQFYTG